jgi:hypothetical protein
MFKYHFECTFNPLTHFISQTEKKTKWNLCENTGKKSHKEPKEKGIDTGIFEQLRDIYSICSCYCTYRGKVHNFILGKLKSSLLS